MRYGIGYMGSKSQIAKEIIGIFPRAEHFVDLFAGGCSMTHCAMLSGKYSRFIINDISDITELFVKGINGEYKGENRWISREDFFRHKDSDAYIRYCWSFSNKGNEYLYGKDIEEKKKAFHYAVFFDDYSLFDTLGIDCPRVPKEWHISEKRKYIGRYFKNIRLESLERLQSLESLESLERLQSLESLESLERLERLQSLESLERLQSLERLERYCGDYRNVEIPRNSIVYCDIPYKGTTKYIGDNFDYNAFYDWADSIESPIFISEYNIDDDRFYPIWEKKKAVLTSHKGTCGNKIEKIYVPKRQIDRYNNLIFKEI